MKSASQAATWASYLVSREPEVVITRHWVAAAATPNYPWQMVISD